MACCYTFCVQYTSDLMATWQKCKFDILFLFSLLLFCWLSLIFIIDIHWSLFENQYLFFTLYILYFFSDLFLHFSLFSTVKRRTVLQTCHHLLRKKPKKPQIKVLFLRLKHHRKRQGKTIWRKMTLKETVLF